MASSGKMTTEEVSPGSLTGLLGVANSPGPLPLLASKLGTGGRLQPLSAACVRPIVPGRSLAQDKRNRLYLDG